MPYRKTALLAAFTATTAFAQFTYDANLPLDPQVIGRESHSHTLVQDITYASAKGTRVPAYLFTQRNASRAPAVVFMHWGLGDRHTFYDEAMALADKGVESILIDAPFTRPDAPKDENDDLAQAVIDVRRAVDLLVARKDVDPKRIGFVGLSYGAHVGALLATVEPRIKALVLAGGDASNADAEKNPALAPYDTEKWIAKKRASSVFLQFARNDEYVSREQAGRFIEAANAIYKWYEGSHAFNAAARADRINWLAAHLGFDASEPTYQPLSPSPQFKSDLGRLGIVTEMPGMQEISSKTITFKPGMQADVYRPFGMTATDRSPVIIVLNGQSDNADFQRGLRTARFTTTLGEALAVRVNRITIIPDIVNEKVHDPADDVRDLIAYITAHAAELQVDPTQIAILSRSAGYSYALRAATNPNVKALTIWYGNLADPNIIANKSVPALVVTVGHDFWSSEDAAQKFVAATGAQRINLPDADHGFEIWDDFEQSRDAFVKTAMFLREHLPVHH